MIARETVKPKVFLPNLYGRWGIVGPEILIELELETSLSLSGAFSFLTLGIFLSIFQKKNAE